MNLHMLRAAFERLMLRTARLSVDAAIGDATAMIERLHRTHDALRTRAERYEAVAERYDTRAAADHQHADRALKVVSKLEDIFGVG